MKIVFNLDMALGFMPSKFRIPQALKLLISESPQSPSIATRLEMSMKRRDTGSEYRGLLFNIKSRSIWWLAHEWHLIK